MPSTARRRPSELLLGALASIALLSLSTIPTACRSPHALPDGLLELGARTIVLPPVVNETTRPLDDVTFGGFVQRSMSGSRGVDFPALLEQSVLESLRSKGYEVVRPASGSDPSIRPASAGSPDDSTEDVSALRLEVTIEAWSGRVVSPLAYSMRYRLRYLEEATGEVLWEERRSVRDQAEPRSPAQTGFIGRSVKSSVRRALEPLPAVR